MRPALDHHTREAVALAGIVAAGCWEAPLAVHVRTGLAAGLTPARRSARYWSRRPPSRGFHVRSAP